MSGKSPASFGARPTSSPLISSAIAEDDGLLCLPAALLGRGGASGMELLGRHLALKYSGVLSAAMCMELVRTIYAGRADWTENFNGLQFTLGRAFYTHLEQEREDLYFADVAASDAIVRRWAPNLQEIMVAAVRLLVQDEVLQRPAWCGAGVHIFPAGGQCARIGGDLHFDTEGLSDEQLETDAPALTCVLMLQPPSSGGGLRVWDSLYAGKEFIENHELPARSVLCQYQRGDLVVIDSHRLHQIMPFEGAVDRISATLHAVYNQERELWEYWF